MFSPLVGLPELARRTVGDPDGIDPSGSDGVRALAALEDASWLVRDAAGRLRDEDWPTEADVPGPLRTIVVRAAIRGWENPEATTGEGVSASGITTSRQAEPNSVYLTEDERRECRRYRPAGGGVSSIALTRGGVAAPTVQYAPDARGGQSWPWLDPEDPAAGG